jgi:hypothetical protein
VTGRDLVAHVIADTTADPILQSVARVVPANARRLGYALIGVCRYCTDAVIVRARGESWVHRGHGTPACLLSLSRAEGVNSR